MPHTIGILAPNGVIGSQVVKYLIPRHQAGEIKLVILHRPGGPARNIPEGVNVESREIDLENGSHESLVSAVKGINVFVDLIAPQMLALEVPLAKALGESKDLIYFVPSLYGRAARPEEKSQPAKQELSKYLHAGRNKALELGVKVTMIDCGFFEHSMFQENLLGANVKKNTLHVSKRQLENPVAITSADYLGAAIASLAMQPPESVAGKTFSAVERNVTGKEIADAFTEIHGGKPTEIIDFTEEDLNNMYDPESWGVAMAGYRENWELNVWPYGPPINVGERPKKSLLDVLEKYK